MDMIKIELEHAVIEINYDCFRKACTDNLNEDMFFDLIEEGIMKNKLNVRSVLNRITYDYKEHIGNLLHYFWQRSSDACPLKASEAEKQEEEFGDWFEDLDWYSLKI